MNFSRGTYNVLRSVLVTVLVTIVALFALAYLLLLMPPVQARLCHEGEKALSEFLNTEVRIGSVSISPFNQLELNDILVNDQHTTNNTNGNSRHGLKVCFIFRVLK